MGPLGWRPPHARRITKRIGQRPVHNICIWRKTRRCHDGIPCIKAVHCSYQAFGNWKLVEYVGPTELNCTAFQSRFILWKRLLSHLKLFLACKILVRSMTQNIVSTQQKDLQWHNKNRIVCDRSLLAWITIDLNSGRRIAEDGIHSGPVTASSHIPAMRLCERKWKKLRPNDVGATEVSY